MIAPAVAARAAGDSRGRFVRLALGPVLVADGMRVRAASTLSTVIAIPFPGSRRISLGRVAARGGGPLSSRSADR
jgi:hypothetical protein